MKYCKKPKLLMDNIVFSLQKAGGGSVYWACLQDYFDKDPSIDVEILEREDAKKNVSRANLEILHSKFHGKPRCPLRIDEIRRVSVSEKTLFHSSYYRSGKGKNCINITTVHDFICMKYYKGFIKWFSFFQIARAVKRSQGLICISESTKRDLLKYIPSAKHIPITVIPHGFDSSYVYKEVPRKNQVVFIGSREVAYKNFWVAVDTVSLVPNLSLVIVGSALTPEEKRELDIRIPNRYISEVYPSAKKVSSIFNESIALLYLSEYEGFGLPLLEAMASGLPVIALNTSSIPEVGGDAVLLLEQASANIAARQVLCLREDENFFSEVVERGLIRSSMFSWEETAKKTRSFYDEMWERCQ